MSVGKNMDITQQYKQSIYNLPMDVSGWDTVTFQFVAPIESAVYIYGSLNDGMAQGVLYPNDNYGAGRATDWVGVQAVNLATGAAVNSVSTAGAYAVPVNTPFLKLGGGGDVYGLFQFNSKIG